MDSQALELSARRDAGSSSDEAPSPAAPFVAKAQVLAEKFGARARDAEAQRRLHDQTIADMLDAGFHRICQPKRFGGYGLSPDVAIETSMKLAEGCGSSGWLNNVITFHAWQISMMPIEAQEEYWSSSETAICATSGFVLNPLVERNEDGAYLSGTWKFASGADFATWFLLTKQDGISPAWMLVPRSDVTVLDNWLVSGLCATGSKDIVLDRVFVPRHRMLAEKQIATGTTPGAALYDSPFYRVPFFSYAPIGLASVVTGVATGLVERFAESKRGKRLPTGELQTDSPSNQIMMASAKTDVDVSRMLIRQALQLTRGWGESGVLTKDADRFDAHRLVVYGIRNIVEMAARIAAAAGANATMLDNPIQRMVRDIMAGASHLGLQYDGPMAAYGSALWNGKAYGKAALRSDV